MSSSVSREKIAPEGVTPEKAVKRLEKAVVAALEEVERLNGEVVRVNAQGEQLEGLLKGVTSGKEGPRELVAKLQILEEENRDLRTRLHEGMKGVDRLLARVKFLENQS